MGTILAKEIIVPCKQFFFFFFGFRRNVVSLYTLRYMFWRMKKVDRISWIESCKNSVYFLAEKNNVDPLYLIDLKFFD